MAKPSENFSRAPAKRIGSKSRIVYRITRFSEYLSRRFSESGTVSLLTVPCLSSLHQDKQQSPGKNRSLIHRTTLPIKRFFNRQAAQSPIASFFSRLGTDFMRLKMKNLGIYYFAFGFVLSIMYLIDRYALNQTYHSFSLYAGLISMLSAIVGCASGKTIGKEVQHSRIMEFIIYRLLGFRHSSPEEMLPLNRPFSAVILGIMTALITRLTSLAFGLLLPPLSLVGYIILAYPEAGLILLCLLIPFLSTAPLLWFLVFLTAALLIKWIQGKRLIDCTILDRTVLTFAVLACLPVLCNPAGQDSISVILLTFAAPPLAFFAASNLCRSSSSTIHLGQALFYAHSVITVAAFVFILTGRLIPDFPAAAYASPVFSTLASICGNRQFISRLYVLTFPIVTARVNTTEKKDRAGIIVLYAMTIIVALITLTGGGWIALIAAMLLYDAISQKKAILHFCRLIVWILIGTACIPSFGSSLATRFDRGIHFIGTKISESGTLVHFLRDFAISGIGYRFDIFPAIGTLYAENTDGIGISGNFLTRLTVILGIPGLLCFLLIFICFISRSILFFQSANEAQPKLRLMTIACFSSVVGYTIGFLFDYAPINPRLTLIYFLMMGFTVGLMRVSQSEVSENKQDTVSIELTIQ